MTQRVEARKGGGLLGGWPEQQAMSCWGNGLGQAHHDHQRSGEGPVRLGLHPVGHRDWNFVSALGRCKPKGVSGSGPVTSPLFPYLKNGTNTLISVHKPEAWVVEGNVRSQHAPSGSGESWQVMKSLTFSAPGSGCGDGAQHTHLAGPS